jgi:hypothetical protein
LFLVPHAVITVLTEGASNDRDSAYMSCLAWPRPSSQTTPKIRLEKLANEDWVLLNRNPAPEICADLHHSAQCRLFATSHQVLRRFVAVAENGGLTRAAAAMAGMAVTPWPKHAQTGSAYPWRKRLSADSSLTWSNSSDE